MRGRPSSSRVIVASRTANFMKHWSVMYENMHTQMDRRLVEPSKLKSWIYGHWLLIKNIFCEIYIIILTFTSICPLCVGVSPFQFMQLSQNTTNKSWFIFVKGEKYEFLVHEGRRSWATYITLLGELKPSYVYQNWLWCFIISQAVSIQSSCVNWHT